MAKQILISERPGENIVKQSIGNYKGVMLCNRPNDPAEKPQRDGPAPFISRVTVKEQLGLNPANKPGLKPEKPKKTLEILNRHKLWLKQLQKQKEENVAKAQESLKAQEEKVEKMKKKYKPKANVEQKSERLTEKNLKTLEKESKKDKPKWALTKEEAEVKEEQEEEKEVDELLQFVSDLDYDEFINDLEVRQAMEIVKERVEEIKKDKEWKYKITEKYNNDDDLRADDARSGMSKNSIKSYESKARSQIGDTRKNDGEWDKSVIST